MIFRQIINDDLGCASYLVGDEDAGLVAVIDPQLDVRGYLMLARYFDVQIRHILETHNHADHVSGHGRLAAATGASIHIHRSAAPEYQHEPFDDGWQLELGSVRITAIHTPGHRPEHTAFALADAARGDEPWALLSGDTLFVGDIARPDLAVEKTEGARHIFRSLQERLLSLPDTCEIWPGHLGGSLCGGPGMDMKVCSTIGYERTHNELLALADEQRFVQRTTSRLGPQPPNFKAIVALNRDRSASAPIDARPLTPHQLERRREDGALIIDVRSDLHFDTQHIPGALCNPSIRAGFATKLSWIAADSHEIVLVGEDDADALRALRLAECVGLRSCGGHLAGGMASWLAEQRPTAKIERIDVAGLRRRRAQDRDLQVLDVREQDERQEGYIPGSSFCPYHDIHGIPEGVDPSRPVAVICSSGQRSAVAASLLKHHGAGQVVHVTNGGVGTWLALGEPLAHG